MPKNIIIPHSKKLEKIIAQIRQDGPDKFHVLADFDRTLTKGFVRGQKCPTAIAQIRNGNYLTPDYSPQAHALADKYFPFEKNHNLSYQRRNQLMQEWWQKHYRLLIKSGLSIKILKYIVSKKTLRFRSGALKLIDLLTSQNIPLVIMSASLGDIINLYLKQENRLYKNVFTVANFLKLNSKQKAIGVAKPIIHSLNKKEVLLKKFPVYKQIKNRTNVLLLGDNIEDIDMISGFNYKNLIKVGFLNYDVKKHLPVFKKHFDIIITNDGPITPVNKLIKEIFK